MISTRNKRNLIFFILSYVTNNLVSGILYDTYVNYMQEVSLSIATSFWSFYGYATFISAILLVIVPKAGYKKLLLFCAISCSLAMFATSFKNVEFIYYITTLLALVGVQLHYIMLAPYVAAYTENLGNASIKWYTRTYYMGYVGYFLSTYLGGVLVVFIFGQRLGDGFIVAQMLTEDIANLSPDLKNLYLLANNDVLLITGVLSLISIIPVILIKEKKEDYSDDTVILENVGFKFSGNEIFKVLQNKYVLIYLVYWSLISFAMGLFTSYFTVFLNRNLHIDKATSSLLVSISYIAIVLFMFLSPVVVRKMGRVYAICFTFIASIPFMIIIANGDSFGNSMVPVVGLALFMRSGLANLGTPAESSLTMSLVSKELRPAFTTCINLLAGTLSIISGVFTGNILFVEQSGYKTAYYIAAVIYAICTLMMYFGFRKFNREDVVLDEKP